NPKSISRVLSCKEGACGVVIASADTMALMSWLIGVRVNNIRRDQTCFYARISLQQVNGLLDILKRNVAEGHSFGTGSMTVFFHHFDFVRDGLCFGIRAEMHEMLQRLFRISLNIG